MMLYIDRTTTCKTYGEVLAYLRGLPEGGLFSESDVRRYEFTAKSRLQDGSDER